jgi:hypothetical protein
VMLLMPCWELPGRRDVVVQKGVCRLLCRAQSIRGSWRCVAFYESDVVKMRKLLIRGRQQCWSWHRSHVQVQVQATTSVSAGMGAVLPSFRCIPICPHPHFCLSQLREHMVKGQTYCFWMCKCSFYTEKAALHHVLPD